MKIKIKVYDVLIIVCSLLLLLNFFIPSIKGWTSDFSFFDFVMQMFTTEDYDTHEALQIPYGIFSFVLLFLPFLLAVIGRKTYKNCSTISWIYFASILLFVISYCALTLSIFSLGFIFGIIVSLTLAILSIMANKKPKLKSFFEKQLLASKVEGETYYDTYTDTAPKRIEAKSTKAVCPFCETIIEDGESFCGGCGQAIGSTEISHVVNKKIDIAPLSSAEAREVPKEKEDSSKDITAGKKTCSACGNVLNEYEIFCGVCGLSTKSSTTASKSSTVVVKEEKITTTPSSIATVSSSGLKSTMRAPKEKSDADRINKEIGNSFFNKADDL